MKFFMGLGLGLLWTTSALAMPDLNDYLGTWQVEKKVSECSDVVTIKKGLKKDSVVMSTHRGKSIDEHTVFKTPSFKSPPKSVVNEYEGYKLFSSSTLKFIRGKIVSASIWAPDTDDWLGVGIKTWFLEKGKLVKRKAGITMQTKTKDSKKRDILFKLDKNGDVLGKWEGSM